MRPGLALASSALGIAISAAAFGQAADDPAGANKPNSQQASPPTKWEERVLKAFFPDARQALVGERPQYATAGAKKGTAGHGDNDATADASAAGGAYSWSKLISADTLQDEIKSLGIQLADEVKTQQGFLGGGNKKARQSLSQLAAMFAIVNDYDADVKWKAQGAVARDLFARAGFNCKAATTNTFKEAKACSEDLSSLLRGESIKPPSSMENKNDWGKVSDLKQLMARLELAQRDHIAAWTSNAGDMQKNAAALAHESEVVAALAQVIDQPGFDNADDDKYRALAKGLQQSAVQLRDAVIKNDYVAANLAAGNLSKACANCHGAFRD